jgi:glycogen debranching enzyme
MSEPQRLLPDQDGETVEDEQPSSSSLVLPASGETEPLVMARGNSFCVVSARGDIAPAGARDLGLFHEDTRHLSYLQLCISGGPPAVLSSETHHAAASQIDLTLTDREFGGFLEDPQNFLHIRRKQILDGALVEQLILTNHLRRPVEMWLELRMGADFADVFEVRGVRRMRRGRILPAVIDGDKLELGYDGLDGARYRTRIRMTPEPTRTTAMGPRWELTLSPGEATILEVVIQPRRDNAADTLIIPFAQRRQSILGAHQDFCRATTHVSCSNVAFESALKHNLEDIDALRLWVDAGNKRLRILGAGIPWFAAPFGRDSIITSLQLLSIAPSLAAETLRTLAHFQGAVVDDWREEEPGKIMHELRRGELARAGEIPHAPYYGTIDATPLWLILLGETHRWMGDDAFVDELMPNAERALEWILTRLQRGAGWLRYQRNHEKGLENQGWKDSRDGVSFPDGKIAEAPIALIEVQGYVVGALESMARLLERRDARRAEQLRVQADALRRRILDEFYVRETGYFAIALDGNGHQVPTITSNPGHLLFVDALRDERASRVVDVLMGEEMYNGWGVRTLARGQAVFNPLSYHNGSVWPHDNALIALGAARQRRPDAALRILEGLYHASLHFRRSRLPELFCGLARGDGDFLVHYPVSCSPQAWASGAFFMLLHACLGLHPDAPAKTLRICNPHLPAFLDKLDLVGLRVGRATVSLHFQRHGNRTHCDLIDVAGDDLRVLIEMG